MSLVVDLNHPEEFRQIASANNNVVSPRATANNPVIEAIVVRFIAIKAGVHLAGVKRFRRAQSVFGKPL